MKWCHNCNIEVEDHIDICPKCKEHIVTADEVVVKKHEIPHGDYEMLTHIFDNVEADVFLSYLESNGIKTYVHFENRGPYKNLLIEPGTEDGTEIFVIKEQLEEAQALMKEFNYEHETRQ